MKSKFSTTSKKLESSNLYSGIKKFQTKNKTIVILTIASLFLLINMTTANSYFIAQTNDFFTPKKIDLKDKLKNTIDFGANVLISFFSIKQIGTVSAGTDLSEFEFNCCPKTKSGAICEDVLSTYQDCAEQLIPTKCEYNADCVKGCCIDEEQGICNIRYLRGECNSDGGKWDPNVECQIPECSRGCCMLGSGFEFTTDSRCELLSKGNFEKKWFQGNEIDCFASINSQEQGACVYSDGSCERLTHDDCKEKGGIPHPTYLCSNPDIGTICTPQDHIGCSDIQGEDEIYWFDSCDNKENIYFANKEKSYNNGKILAEKNSCGANDEKGNADSETCGNCDRTKGSFCAQTKSSETHVQDGNYVCKDLSCRDEKGNKRKNGESWCIYESNIGESSSPFGNQFSSDTVGSVHYKAMCIDGEVKIEQCADYRKEICEMGIIEDAGVEFSRAMCVLNQADICLSYNSKAQEECQSYVDEKDAQGYKNCINDVLNNKCLENEQCRIQVVDVNKKSEDLCLVKKSVRDTTKESELEEIQEACLSVNDNADSACSSYTKNTDAYIQCVHNEVNNNCPLNENCEIHSGKSFNFNVCVGKYPLGLDLTPTEEESKENQAICGMATVNCTIVDVKKNRFAHWHCSQNCECKEPIFAQQMNDMCVSMGDCGSYVNYIGTGTDNTEISGNPDYTPKEISWDKYKKFINPKNNEYAEFGNNSEVLEALFGKSNYKDLTEEELNSFISIAGATSGSLGVGVAFGLYLSTIPGGSLGAGANVASGSTLSSIEALKLFSLATAKLMGFTIVAGIIGHYAGKQLAKMLGLQKGGLAEALVVASVTTAATSAAIFIATSTFAAGSANVWNPIGLVLLVIAVIEAIVAGILGNARIRENTITFQCMPYQAPTASSDATCGKCTDEKMLEAFGINTCTEYKCESLGSNCKLINADTDNPECKSLTKENQAPILDFNKAITPSGYSLDVSSNKRVKLETNAKSKCIPAFTPIQIKVPSDEHAQCKYSFEKPSANNYLDMEGNYLNDNNAYLINHTINIYGLSLASLGVYDVKEAELRKKLGNMRMYIRCQDYWGNYNLDEYLVEFCIEQEDKTPVDPARIVFNPKDDSYLPFGTTEKNITMYVPEPAECKYDTRSHISYENMQYEMTCDNSNPLIPPTINGWPCTTTLNVSKGENNFYFRCKDKPFAGVAEEDRNPNKQDFPYTLHVSEDKLEITEVSFSTKVLDEQVDFEDGDKLLFGGQNIFLVDMKVRTSGGMLNGQATCQYGVIKDGQRWYMFETGGTSIHSQPGIQKSQGKHNTYIECEDDAGNKANKTVSFEIELDNTAPLIARAFYDSGSLEVMTTEKARCYYDETTCNFDLENAITMTSGYDTEHSADWEIGKTYYIKCKDKWENENPTCAIIVKAEEENTFTTSQI